VALTLYDEFAGWGGSAQGGTAVPGVELIFAANHDELAVEVHSMNFPRADHYLGDVASADITRFPRADLFWASPVCPPWTDARGKRRDFDRSAQNRNRLYLGYWLAKLGREPDWDKWLRPRAWCPTCDEMVDAVQAWKRPGLDMGSYGPRYGQYVYRCPRRSCRHQAIEPDVLPAAVAIDRSLPPGQRIGERIDAKGRPDPLQPATIARIQAWFDRHRQARALLTPAGGTWRDAATSVDEPMPTRTTRDTDGLVPPPLLVPTTSRDGVSAYPAGEPLRTQTCRQETALVQTPFVATLRGGGSRYKAYGVDEPLTTFSAKGTHHGLVTPPGAEGVGSAGTSCYWPTTPTARPGRCPSRSDAHHQGPLRAGRRA
jgi:DNA (cytosine-5)-methyltransferase 1